MSNPFEMPQFSGAPGEERRMIQSRPLVVSSIAGIPFSSVQSQDIPRLTGD
ncbi:MAG: hypothetical protein GY903_12375 [Fuerstiella sp.]|nr:hypothetical protein [Fuerstiella sp.]MCP4855278.1 hypothetical protein [Fuerstiella sp.]